MGLFLGLSLGIIMALALEVVDNTIKTTYDIERNLAVLGIIPSIGENQKNKRSYFFNKSNKSSSNLKRRLITQDDPKSPVLKHIVPYGQVCFILAADKDKIYSCF